ncbi:CBS domain-containing protein [Candidatus Woesearchaeota archaeon]|nr:CBS domain-containing protein [Candidatus Woesearchaeota archaeon]
MKTGLKVIDAMTKRPIGVLPNTSIQECAKLMKKYDVGNLLIMEDNKLLGILTEQDLVYKVIAKEMDLKRTKAKHIMEKDVITISPEKDIDDALKKMRNLNVRRLPVISKGEVIGILTQKDVLKIEPQLFEIIVDKIELREEANKPINKIGEREGICELCGEYTNYLYKKQDSMVCFNCRQNII